MNEVGDYVMPKQTETVAEKLDKLTDAIERGGKQPKEKPFKMPIKGKLGNGQLRKGFATICIVQENNSVDFKKEKIIDGTIKLGDTFHAVSSDDILNYKGKPFIIQAKKSNNPINPNQADQETHGQKHIMSRMLNETLATAKKIGIAGISIGVIIIGGVIIYALIGG